MWQPVQTVSLLPVAHIFVPPVMPTVKLVTPITRIVSPAGSHWLQDYHYISPIIPAWLIVLSAITETLIPVPYAIMHARDVHFPAPIAYPVRVATTDWLGPTSVQIPVPMVTIPIVSAICVHYVPLGANYAQLVQGSSPARSASNQQE